MIVSCGEALVDLIPKDRQEGSPASAIPGGGPMNAAIAASRLDVPAAFIGRVSNDAHGDTIWAHMESNGVNLAAAERGDEPTAMAVVEYKPQLVFRFEGEGTADSQLHAANLDVLDAPHHTVHGGTLGMFRGRTAEVLANLVERHQGLVSLDPNVRPQIITNRSEWDHFHERWVAQADIYKASDEDLEWTWPARSAHSVAEELMATGVSCVLMTRGANGATVFFADGEVAVPGVEVDVVDTVGAGDTFIATILATLHQRGTTSAEALNALTTQDWTSMLQRATRASAITCSRAGANPPTAAELADAS